MTIFKITKTFLIDAPDSKSITQAVEDFVTMQTSLALFGAAAESGFKFKSIGHSCELLVPKEKKSPVPKTRKKKGQP